jgi:hypothetical protein
MNSKMISIFWFCLRFRFILRVRARESLTGIHLLLSSQHSSRASPKRTYLPECPEALTAANITVYRTRPPIFTLISRKLAL